MHTELTDAWLHLENASVSLTAALGEASTVEALILVPLIGDARRLRDAIDALRSAVAEPVTAATPR